MTKYHSLVFIGVLSSRCTVRVRSFSPNTQLLILLRHEGGCGVGATMYTAAGWLDIHTVHDHSSLIHVPLVHLLFPLFFFFSFLFARANIYSRSDQEERATTLGGGGETPTQITFFPTKNLHQNYWFLTLHLTSLLFSIFCWRKNKMKGKYRPTSKSSAQEGGGEISVLVERDKFVWLCIVLSCYCWC